MSRGAHPSKRRRRADDPEPKFVVDAMLGSTARKLRIFGFDTLYFGEGGDADLLALARSEERILLTADKGLAGAPSARGGRVVLVQGRTERARLRCIKELSPGTVEYLLGADRPSRCAVCNGELDKVVKGDLEGVPPKVVARHRLFYRCRECSRPYWRGRHWDRLRHLSYSLR